MRSSSSTSALIRRTFVGESWRCWVHGDVGVGLWRTMSFSMPAVTTWRKWGWKITVFTIELCPVELLDVDYLKRFNKPVSRQNGVDISTGMYFCSLRPRLNADCTHLQWMEEVRDKNMYLPTVACSESTILSQSSPDISFLADVNWEIDGIFHTYPRKSSEPAAYISSLSNPGPPKLPCCKNMLDSTQVKGLLTYLHSTWIRICSFLWWIGSPVRKICSAEYRKRIWIR